MKLNRYNFRNIFIWSALLFVVPVLCLNPSQRTAIQKLTQDIKENKITKEAARARALSFKLARTDFKDRIVDELIITADANGIPDIFFEASVPKPVKTVTVPTTSQPLQAVPVSAELLRATEKTSVAGKPIERTPVFAKELRQAAPELILPTKPQETTKELPQATPVSVKELPQAAEKISVAGKPIERKPELILPPEKLPDATFNALKGKVKTLKKNYTTMSPQEIDAAIDEIKKGFAKVSTPADITEILTKIEKFKEKLTKDIAAINKLGTQLVDQELPAIKSKLTDPKVIKNLPQSMRKIQDDINEKKAEHLHNKSVQTAAYNASRALKNSLYKVIQESMKQAAQLNDNILLYKLIKKYPFAVFKYPFYSEKHTEQLLQVQREQELKAELEDIAKLVQKTKEEAVQKQIREKEEQITKELNELRKTIQQTEKNVTILLALEANDHYMMISPKELDKQLDLIDQNLLTEVQNELFDKIIAYQDYVLDEVNSLVNADTKINDARTFIAQKSTDADQADEYLNMLHRLLSSCNERREAARKEGKQNSWLVQQFDAIIKIIQPLKDTVEDIWFTLEEAGLKQQNKEDKALDALTQTTETPRTITSTPSNKEKEFEAAVKKADGLLAQKPTDAAIVEEQAKELEKLLNDYYRPQKMQDKVNILEPLIKKLDELAKKLDEEQLGTRKPTQVEFDNAIKNTINLTLKNPTAIEPWRTQFEELNRFSRFYEQELEAGKREQQEYKNNPARLSEIEKKMKPAQDKLSTLRPYIQELSDQIIELEGTQIIVTPALKETSSTSKQFPTIDEELAHRRRLMRKEDL